MIYLYVFWWFLALHAFFFCTETRVRNFPNDAENGEHLLRKAYEEQMERLGVVVEDGGLLVDLGCGSGTSTRCVVLRYGGARVSNGAGMRLVWRDRVGCGFGL